VALLWRSIDKNENSIIGAQNLTMMLKAVKIPLARAGGTPLLLADA
jgi:hypothetical protein